MFKNEEYRIFCEEVKNNMKDYLPGKYQDISISLYEAIKNNGVKRIGLTFSKEHEEVSPTIYLEEFYEMLLEGKTIKEICLQLSKIYECAVSQNIEYEKIKDFEKIKDSIYLTMVNYERNQEMLEKIPHVVIDDFAVYYRIFLYEEADLIASTVIKQEMLKAWEISQKELHVLAYENTRRILKPKLTTMGSMLEFKDENLFEAGKPDKDEIMYVLSACSGKYGAVMIFYPNLLEEVRTIIGKDFYILPVSIHKTILVTKDSSLTPVDLGKMVRKFNEIQVELEEQLGDHIYEVEFDTDEMKIVSVKESMKDSEE